MIKAHRNLIFITLIDQQHSRLVLPPMYKKSLENVQRGIVKAAGPKSYVNIGETIVFDKWAGHKIQVHGEDMLIIQPHNLVVVEK